MATFSTVVPQCDRASAVTIFSAGTGVATTSSGTAGPFPVDFFSSCDITSTVTTCSGTLQIWVQKRLPDGINFDDVACITSLTSSAEVKTLSFVNGGNLINLKSDKSFASGTVITCHFGSYWRLAWTIAGTGPSHEFGIYGDFRS